MGGSPPGSAGVPPAQILPQLRPSPPPESTGSGALPLLRPGPCGSRRQGGRLQHRRETERQPKGQHAGGTPALPGVSSRWSGGGYPAGDFSESRPVPFGRLPFACEPGARPPRLGRSIEKDYKLNIDAQDNQDGTLLHKRLTLAMIARGFVDSLDDKSAVSRKNPVHPVHRCESEIHPCSTPGPDVGIVGRNYLSFWADGTSIGDGNLVSETGHQPLITVHYSLFRAAAPHDGTAHKGRNRAPAPAASSPTRTGGYGRRCPGGPSALE